MALYTKNAETGFDSGDVSNVNRYVKQGRVLPLDYPEADDTSKFIYDLRQCIAKKSGWENLFSETE